MRKFRKWLTELEMRALERRTAKAVLHLDVWELLRICQVEILNLTRTARHWRSKYKKKGTRKGGEESNYEGTKDIL